MEGNFPKIYNNLTNSARLLTSVASLSLNDYVFKSFCKANTELSDVNRVGKDQCQGQSRLDQATWH